jgi:hypothetical protein
VTADALSKQAVMWVQKKDFISLLRMGWNAVSCLVNGFWHLDLEVGDNHHLIGHYC